MSKTLLDRFPQVFEKKKPKAEDKFALHGVVKSLYSDLDSETQSRLNDYETYHRFYLGDQWFGVTRDNSRHKYTNNYCEPIAIKYAALLMGNTPRIMVPQRSQNNIEEDLSGFKGYGEETPDFSSDENRSEALEKILRKITYRDNPGSQIFLEGATGGSIYGDTVFYVPFDEKETTFKIQTVFPGYVRIAFSSDDFTEIDHLFVVQTMSCAAIYKKYGIEVQPENTLETNNITWNPQKFAQGDYAAVKTYWDDDVKIVFTDSELISYKKHNLPELPFFHIRNRINPNNPWGKSDIQDVIPIQERLNIATSNQADIIELFANPKVITKNLSQRDVEALKQARGNVLSIRRDADISLLEFKNNIFPIQQEIQEAMKAIHDISGIPPVFFGASQGSIVTGVALTAQAAPTLQIVNSKLQLWLPALEKMFAYMLKTLEKRGGKIKVNGETLSYKDLIAGEYKVTVRSDVRMPRDDGLFIQNEINKANFGLQAKMTAMENTGIESPEDEMKKIAFEKLHPLFNPEFALQHAQQRINLPTSMDKEATDAISETERMLQGEQLPGTAGSVDGHALHLEIHSRAVEEDPNMPEDIKLIIDQHMAEHEQAMGKINNNQLTPKFPKSKGETNFPTSAPQLPDTNNPMIPQGGAGNTAPLPPQQALPPVPGGGVNGG